MIPVVAELKTKARGLGLWNLFLSQAHYPKYGVPLSNLEVGVSKNHSHFLTISVMQYAVMAEVLGRGGHMASETVNCSAPDTGNMGGSLKISKLLNSQNAGRGSCALRVTRTAEEVARAPSQRRDSFCLCDDREVRYVYSQLGALLRT